MSGLVSYTAADLALTPTYAATGSLLGSPDTVSNMNLRYVTAAWQWKAWQLVKPSYSATEWDLIASLIRDYKGDVVSGSKLAAVNPAILTCVSALQCTWYETVQGDTPAKIATAFSVNVNALMTLNGWTDAQTPLEAHENVKIKCS